MRFVNVRILPAVLVLFVGSMLVCLSTVVSASESSVIQRILSARELAANGQFQEAKDVTEAVLPEALAIFGKQHANYAYILDDLSRYLTTLGSVEQAILYSLEALQIADIDTRITDVDRANFEQNLASAYVIKGEIVNAIGSLERTVGFLRSTKDFAKQVAVSSRLVELLVDSRRLNEAKELLDTTSFISERHFGIGDENTIQLMLQSARLALIESDLESAETTITSIPITDDSLSDRVRAEIEITKSRLAAARSDFQQANIHLDSAETMLARSKEPLTLSKASIEYNRGNILLLMGDVVEAHDRFLAANDQYAITHDRSHPASLRSLQGRALALMMMGAYEDSDSIFEIITETQLDQFGENSQVLADTLTQWSFGLGKRGLHDQALELAYRVAQIHEANVEIADFDRLLGTATMAFAKFNSKQYDDAFKLLKTTIAGFTRFRGDESQDLVPGYLALAELVGDKAEYTMSAKYLEKARQILSRSAHRTPEHWSNMYYLEAKNATSLGLCEETIRSSESGINVISDYIERSSGRAGVPRSSIRKNREILEKLVKLLHHCLGKLESPNKVLEIAFRAFQIPQLQSTASAIEQLKIVDAASIDSELGALLRTRRDLLYKLSALERDQQGLLTADGLSSVAYGSLSDNFEQLSQEYKATNDRLRGSFPEYGDFFIPRAYSLEAIQRQLNENSLMLLTLSTPNKLYTLAISSDFVSFGASDLTRSRVTNIVSSLRFALDVDNILSSDEFPEFDTHSSHELYLGLMKEHVQLLGNADHMVIVADGALQTLPFSVLLRSKPTRAPTKLSHFAGLDYLVKSHSISYLPSAGSLVALNSITTGTVLDDRRKFIGFGDPVVDHSQKSGDRRGGSTIPGLSGSVADDFIFTRLPEAAEELTEISRMFGVDRSQIYTGAQSTEKQLSSLDLTGVEILAFATHGVMADELVPYYSEPGLLMTPITRSGSLDSTDLLLTTSEIAQLKTDAELVLLSACNTAAAAVSDPNAEGLSGLARSFFHAGAKSLLVTHWYVDSMSSQYTTKTMVGEYLKRDRREKAKALRQVALDFLAGEQGLNRSHPAFWAAFVLIGVE